MAIGAGTTPQAGSAAPTPPTGLTQSEVEDRVAASVLDSLDELDEKPSKPAEHASTEAQSDAPPEDADAPAEEATDSDADPAEDETDPEAETEEAKEPKAAPQPGDDVKVRLDDNTEVTLAELKRGFLREADYTRKTQEVSAQRKAVEQERTSLTQFTEQQIAALQIVAQIQEEATPPDPPTSLLRENPEAFYNQKALYEQGQRRKAFLQQKYAETQQHLAHLRQQEEQQERAKLEEVKRQETQLLFQKMPELKTEQGKAKFFQEIDDIGPKAWGITSEQVRDNCISHAEHLILRDALAFRRLQASKMEAVRQAKTTPPLRPGNRPAPGQRQKARQEAAQQRLRQEGTIEAAMAAIPDTLFE